jgi:Spy/CpxP family protein refolding chaperone
MVPDMKLKILLLPFLAATAWSPLLAQSTAPSGTLEAEEHGQHEHWRHHHGEWFLKKLNLSDDQRNQIKQFRSDNKPAFRTAMLNLLTAQKSLQDAIYKNPKDEATISSLSASVTNARTQLALQKANFYAALQNILTPEQKQQLDQMHQKRQDWLQKRIDRLNAS